MKPSNARVTGQSAAATCFGISHLHRYPGGHARAGQALDGRASEIVRGRRLYARGPVLEVNDAVSNLGSA